MLKKDDSLTQALLLKQFAQYTKRIAHFYISLQKNKRQLCEFLQSIDQYILPFSQLDLDKKGLITQKDLQLFLIRHKKYFKPEQIDRYFQKYVHGKNQLDYDDILQALLPHSKYILMSAVLHNNPKFGTNSKICEYSSKAIIENILALIVSEEIEFLSRDFVMMNTITNGSHQVGAILWIYLDREHNNQLNFLKMKNICQEFDVQLKSEEWQAFINWHFRNHKKTLRRADFMSLCDIHITNKRNRSQCNYEKQVMKKQQEKACLEERQRKKRIEEGTMEKIEIIRKMRGSSCDLRNIVREEQFPDQLLDRKILLGGKLGYAKPRKCIKHAEVLKPQQF